VLPATVIDRVSRPRHAASCLDGAAGVGEASGGERLLVRVGIWYGREGRRARYRATTCASLIAFAEAACELVEEGRDPRALAAGDLHRRVPGVHPVHRDRAELVARALRQAAQAAQEGADR
jgi:hypothetical protein